MSRRGHYEDLTNRRFSKLVCMWPAGRNRHEQTVWLCLCDCGKYVPVVMSQLKNKESKSCGCLKTEYCRQRATHGRSGTAPFHMLCSARGRAKKLGIPFDLVLEDIVIPEKCPLLGIPLKFNKGKTADDSPTVDRIIPESGYTKKNIHIISYRANRIKNNSTLDEFETIAKNWRALQNARA